MNKNIIKISGSVYSPVPFSQNRTYRGKPGESKLWYPARPTCPQTPWNNITVSGTASRTKGTAEMSAGAN